MNVQQQAEEMGIEGLLPGPCPDGFFHFDFHGVPTYINGETNDLFAEDGTPLIYLDGQVCDKIKLMQALTQETDEDFTADIKRCNEMQQEFLLLLNGCRH